MNQKQVAQFEKRYRDKREGLFLTLIRQASSLCGRSCVSYKRSLDKIQKEPDDESWIALTEGEEICVKRCVDKFLKTRTIMERILSESSSPLFYSEFIPNSGPPS